uniref:Chloride channel CLIC-like protein 1 n=1 Tax=Angiostrongylus cantonensis TaxID=6313 RepID=A0A158P819_ANGCA
MENAENEPVMKEQVRGALHNMIEVHEDDPPVSAWEEIVTVTRPWISLLNMMILPPALFLLLRSMMSSRSFWTCVLSAFFVISMVTTYNRIYQEKLALRIAESMERKKDACAPNSLVDQTLEYFSSFISFQRKSSCLSFIESQTVSIVSDISLLDVFSDVLSNSIFGVLGHFGRHTNRFFREFYANIPIPAMLLMTITLILANVRIETPFFTWEPMFITTVHYTLDTIVRCIRSETTAACNGNEATIQRREEPNYIEERDYRRGRAALRHRRPNAALCVDMRERPRSRNTLSAFSRSSSATRSMSNPR